MNEIERAIKELRIQQMNPNCSIMSYNSCEVAIQALEKQIAKKPIKVIITKKYGGITIKCPSCDSEFVGTKLCLDCGQKLDWKEE